MLVIGLSVGSATFPSTRTQTTRLLSTMTVALTQVIIVGQTVTKNITITQTQSNVLPAEFLCSPVYFHQYYFDGTAPPNVPVIFTRQNSTVAICVRYYYYNSASTETFNTTSVLNVGIVGTTREFYLQSESLDTTTSVQVKLRCQCISQQVDFSVALLI